MRTSGVMWPLVCANDAVVAALKVVKHVQAPRALLLCRFMHALVYRSFGPLPK